MKQAPRSIAVIRRRFVAAGVGLSILGTACVGDYERHSPNEVRTAIEAKHIIGATPEQVIAALGAVRLSGGDTLQVDPYLEDGERRVVEATVPDAKRTGRVRWSVDVVVSFDSTRRARRYEVEYSAVNPM